MGTRDLPDMYAYKLQQIVLITIQISDITCGIQLVFLLWQWKNSIARLSKLAGHNLAYRLPYLNIRLFY